MPGLVPGIHVLRPSLMGAEDVDGRVKPGHDDPHVFGFCPCPQLFLLSPRPMSPQCPRLRA
ncbi:hypothetical protein FFI89_033475 [Bradyrhizobium sp. KBS0727]|nr:hypothetical protein FFI71_033480 [Bradyrhizobium sp. KBS0725]QDW48209.1 hypothetical protein FFI89_033475 [Bradyrhizobium sp. KBS0727]